MNMVTSQFSHWCPTAAHVPLKPRRRKGHTTALKAFDSQSAQIWANSYILWSVPQLVKIKVSTAATHSIRSRELHVLPRKHTTLLWKSLSHPCLFLMHASLYSQQFAGGLYLSATFEQLLLLSRRCIQQYLHEGHSHRHNQTASTVQFSQAQPSGSVHLVPQHLHPVHLILEGNWAVLLLLMELKGCFSMLAAPFHPSTEFLL